MSGIIPQVSPWENKEVWDKDRTTTPNPEATGSATRGAPRGGTSRGRSSRGRPPFPTRGRGRGQQQTFWRDYSHERFDPYAYDRGFEAPEGYSSGPGRSSGGVRERRRDSPHRPGYRETEEHREPREPRDSRDYREYDYSQEEPTVGYRDRREHLRSYRGRDPYESRQDGHYSDGYFCSFISLTDNDTNTSLSKDNFRKQTSKEYSKYSKYNKAYMDNMNNKCLDIVNNFFKTCTDYHFDQYIYFLKPNKSGFFRYKDLPTPINQKPQNKPINTIHKPRNTLLSSKKDSWLNNQNKNPKKRSQAPKSKRSQGSRTL